MEDTGLKIVAWLIVFTGTLCVVSGCIYISLSLVGRIVRMLGYWDVLARAIRDVYRRRRSRDA